MHMLRTTSTLALLLACSAGAQEPVEQTAPVSVSPQEMLLGVVRLADGRPWVGAEVHVIGSRFFWRDGLGECFRATVTTGPRGRFRIRVPADRQYSLYAVSPEKDWKSSGRFLISDLLEGGCAGRVLELRARDRWQRAVKLTIEGRGRAQGALRCELVGRSVNFDRVSLPVAEDGTVIVPPRAGGSALLVFSDDRGPIGQTSPRYSYANGDPAFQGQNYELPAPRRYEISVLDKKSKKPIEGAVVRHVLREHMYADTRVISYQAGRWLIQRRLGTTGVDGVLGANVPTTTTSRGKSLAQLRVDAPGYSMVSTRSAGNRLKTLSYEVLEPKEGAGEDAPTRIRVLLEAEKPRSLRLLGKGRAPLAGLRVIYRGQGRLQLDNNSYTSFYLAQNVHASDEDGRIVLPARSPQESKQVDLLVDAAFLRALGLPTELLGELPPTMPLHSGGLWGDAADKDFDLAKARILRGRVLRPDGRPQRAPSLILEPAKRRTHSFREVGTPWNGGRDGSFARLLLPGSYMLACMEPEAGYVLEELEIEAGEGPLERTLALKEMNFVSGRVVDAAGQPLAGATLSVAGWSMSGSMLRDRFAIQVNQRHPLATSDEQGRFRFTFIPTTNVRMNFRASFRPKDARRTVYSQGRLQFGSETQKDLELVVPVDAPKPKGQGKGAGK